MACGLHAPAQALRTSPTRSPASPRRRTAYLSLGPPTRRLDLSPSSAEHTSRVIPGSRPTPGCAGPNTCDLLFPVWSLPKLALRSKPADLPDPFAELLIFG